jgi:pimeloyl-ACP methyl ester carboxylesterase
LAGLDDDEKLIAHQYLYQTSMINGTAEKAIFRLMEMPILAYSPIFDGIDKMKKDGIELYFVYGDRDWIDTDMGGEHMSKVLKDRGEKVFVLDDCDHQLYLDNPVQLLESLDE